MSTVSRSKKVVKSAKVSNARSRRLPSLPITIDSSFSKRWWAVFIRCTGKPDKLMGLYPDAHLAIVSCTCHNAINLPQDGIALAWAVEMKDVVSAIGKAID
jgi:hypothetical protein